MLYLDLLDSVKSANQNINSSKNWWRPDYKAQQNTIALAEAALMSRILYGYPIILSNNQMIDSVALMLLGERIQRLSIGKTPPVLFNFYGKDYTAEPNTFLRLLIDSFKNEQFKKSAWASLEDDKAKEVANYLTNCLSQYDSRQIILTEMFNHIHLDKSVENDFERLAEGLNYLFRYLNEGYKDNQKVCICTPLNSNEKNKRSIWEGLITLSRQGSGIYSDEFELIKYYIYEQEKKQKRNDLRENRSELYNAIENATNYDEDRSRLKRFVDVLYNERMSDSVSSGYGLFTMTDVCPPIDINEQSKRMTQVDEAVPSDKTDVEVVMQLEFYNPKEKKPDCINWDDIYYLLSNPNFIDKRKNLQREILRLKKIHATNTNYYEKQQKITQDAYNEFKRFVKESLAKSPSKYMGGFIFDTSNFDTSKPLTQRVIGLVDDEIVQDVIKGGVGFLVGGLVGGWVGGSAGGSAGVIISAGTGMIMKRISKSIKTRQINKFLDNGGYLPEA